MKRFCTASPNFNRPTQTCCEQHDADYAGHYYSRAEADRRLLMCVASHGMPWRAVAMFVAVRLFGWLWYGRGR
jgi:hypothetical protein